MSDMPTFANRCYGEVTRAAAPHERHRQQSRLGRATIRAQSGPDTERCATRAPPRFRERYEPGQFAHACP